MSVLRRIKLPAVALTTGAFLSFYAWVEFLSTFWRPGAIGLNLKAPGIDWVTFYGAARLALVGKAGLIFNGRDFASHLNSTFSWWYSASSWQLEPMPFLYPPSYLLLLLPFGELTLGASYAVFEAATAVLLAAVLYFDADEPRGKVFVIASALLCPAAAFNVALGQNAFLVAALLVGGFRILRKRPLLSGAVLGLLTFKPQFWILIPVALVAGREWRALFASMVAAAALVGASAAVLGVEVWLQWLHMAFATYANSSGDWVLTGRIAGDSVWACLVASGSPLMIANALQIAAILLAAVAVYACFRLPLSPDLKLAALLGATVFAAPHSMIYDEVMLAVAAALWIVPRPLATIAVWNWLLALSLYLLPLLGPPWASPLARLTPLLVLCFVGAIIAQGVRGLGAKVVLGEEGPGPLSRHVG